MAGKPPAGGTPAITPDALVAMYQAKVDEAVQIVDKLTALAGTMAEWQSKGKAAAEATVLADYVTIEPGTATMLVPEDLFVTPTTTLGEYLTAVSNYLTECQQFGNEVMTAWLKDHAPSTDERTALRDRLAILDTEAASFRMVITQLAPDVELPEFPAAPKGGTSGGTRQSAKSSNVTFYRVKDGERVPQSSNQHSLSSMAFYHFGKCGVDALRAAIAKQHGKVDETKSWEGEVTVEYGGATRTWVIGWDVAEPTKSDESKADESK